MTPVEIILAIVLAILLIHHIWFAIKAANAVTQHKRVIEALHGTGPSGSWPPDDLKFP